MRIGSLVLALGIGSTALAGGQQQQQADWDALRDLCQQYEDNEQAKKFRVRVVCKERRHVWQPEGRDAYDGQLVNRRWVSAEAVAKVDFSADRQSTYNYGEVLQDEQARRYAWTCPMFKQVEQTLEEAKTLTCEQLLAERRSYHQYCEEEVLTKLGEKVRAARFAKSSVSQKPLQVVSVCAGQAAQKQKQSDSCCDTGCETECKTPGQDAQQRQR